VAKERSYKVEHIKRRGRPQGKAETRGEEIGGKGIKQPNKTLKFPKRERKFGLSKERSKCVQLQEEDRGATEGEESVWEEKERVGKEKFKTRYSQIDLYGSILQTVFKKRKGGRQQGKEGAVEGGKRTGSSGGMYNNNH